VTSGCALDRSYGVLDGEYTIMLYMRRMLEGLSRLQKLVIIPRTSNSGNQHVGGEEGGDARQLRRRCLLSELRHPVSRQATFARSDFSVPDATTLRSVGSATAWRIMQSRERDRSWMEEGVPTDSTSAGEPFIPAQGPEVRASDADRDRVIGVLRIAAADGQLTVDELGERMGAALSSRTLGELAVLIGDLVAGPGRAGTVTAQAEEVIGIDQCGGSADAPSAGWFRGGWIHGRGSPNREPTEASERH